MPVTRGESVVPRLLGALGAAALLTAGCTDSGTTAAHTTPPAATPSVSATPTLTFAPTPTLSLLPGMPPVPDPNDIYSFDAPGQLNPTVRDYPNLVYVPNSESDTVDVIDPATGSIVEHVAVPKEPQHVVPSYDLKTLWVNSDQGNALTPIDPATGKPGTPVPVDDPYNLYFTPDGKYAVVMAERLKRIDFRDPQTMALKHSLAVPCAGVNHADFSADGRYFIVSCEFSGQILKVDTEKQELIGTIDLPNGGMPQDVKTAPDGSVFYVADMDANGVWLIDGDTFTKPDFIPTGKGAHGLYVSRDSRTLYVTNRGEGSISTLDLATHKVTAKWAIPGGGSPDMGGVSADGTSLWLAGRYDGVVYEISTTDGKLLRKIPVGRSPHGLCVYPQPGRYSLGHTGVFR